MKYILSLSILGLSLSAMAAPVASGTLILPKNLEPKATGIRTVFITVQDPAAQMPMPCAAQKFTLPKDAVGGFLSFSLEPGTLMMMACKEIPDTMNIKARLDKDGNAGPDSTGDIVGILKGVKKGSKNLKIELAKVIE